MFREFTNQEIQEDKVNPKEPADFDLKYIKSDAGPLYKMNEEG